MARLSRPTHLGRWPAPQASGRPRDGCRRHRRGDVAGGSRERLTPGHTEEDAREDRTPDEDPLAADQRSIVVNRERFLAVADVVIPGHGGPIRVER